MYLLAYRKYMIIWAHNGEHQLEVGYILGVLPNQQQTARNYHWLFLMFAHDKLSKAAVISKD